MRHCAKWTPRAGGLAPLLFSLLVLCASGALAQGSVNSVRFGVDYRHWNLERSGDHFKETASQLSYPFAMWLGLHPSLDLMLAAQGAASAYDPVGRGTEDLRAFPDVTSYLRYRTLDGRLVLVAGANLPVGTNRLSLEEFEVARIVGHPLVAFRTREAGRGLDLGASVTWGAPLTRKVSYAFGVGFVDRNKFDLIEDEGEYLPASEMSVSFGLDTQGERTPHRLSLDATARFYGEDKLAGTKIYEKGSQLELQGVVDVRGLGLRSWVMGRVVTKSDDRSFQDLLAKELRLSPGTAYFLRAGTERGVSRGADLGLTVEWNRYSGSNVAGENGDLVSLGPTFSASLGRELRMKSKILYSFGSIEGGPVMGVDRVEPDRDLRGVILATDFHWVARRDPRKTGTAWKLPPAAAHGEFAVHVSTFTKESHAQEEIEILAAESRGLTGFMRRVWVPRRGSLIRVFVGPYATREQAEEAAVQIRGWRRSFTCAPVVRLADEAP